MQISISHYEFSLREPFSAGHKLTIPEAQALNALRAENIRNNAYRTFGKFAKGEDGLLKSEDLAELKTFIASQDEQYSFRPKAGPKAKSGTIEAEIGIVAGERVEEQARIAGVELTVVQYSEALAAFKANPGVEEEARRRLGERIRANSKSIEELFS